MSSSSSTPPLKLRRHPDNGRWYGVVRRKGHEVTFSTKTKDEDQAKRIAERMLKVREAEWRVRDGVDDAFAETGEQLADAVRPRPRSELAGNTRLERPPVDLAAARDKLRALGGAAPLSAATGEAPKTESTAPPPGAPGSPENPTVLSPDQAAQEKAKAEEEKKEDLDDEASNLFADMLGGAIVGGHQRFVKRVCENAEPPKRAGEPNELMLEWERLGIQKKCRKLMGKSGGLTETQKLLIGVVGVTVSMVWNAEEIPESERKKAAAPAQTAQRPAAPPAQTAHAPAPTESATPGAPPVTQPQRSLALVPQKVPAANEAAAGRFKS